MVTLFGKKKLTEDRVANVFVNGIQALIDSGFEDVVGLINDSPEFIQSPELKSEDIGPFTMIVLAGNLQMIPAHFPAGQDKRITEHVLEKFATLYELEKMDLAQMVSDTRKFMARKNHPSKNTVNGMAKGLFCRYELNNFQEEYFRNLQSPNPIFIQRLKDALENFMWNWAAITEKYKVVQHD
ncbi:hypothetical protein G3O08_05200 [Cryomorpha ignava]|uniref:Uncharacterized protein n=1 Tax=Cryomorpha ignava TaxID=101383 RepID=A0A7K3WML4_9FLAO|nr:hypothetical protein [Cryomorpha ignava]NEN22893.1 hypothetical protein [Cryomorpha ignava]